MSSHLKNMLEILNILCKTGGTVLERISSADSVQINERILFSDIKKETSTNKLFNMTTEF